MTVLYHRPDCEDSMSNTSEIPKNKMRTHGKCSVASDTESMTR